MDIVLGHNFLLYGILPPLTLRNPPFSQQTLMDVVLGRKTVGFIRGDIFVNGHPKEQATWSRVCGCE